MIDNSELTDEEIIELKTIALERRKKQLQKEIEDIKYQQRGLKNGKSSLSAIAQYFKD